MAADTTCDNLAFTWSITYHKLTLNLFFRCHIEIYTAMSVQGIAEKERSGVVTASVLYTCTLPTLEL